ncbi:PadR family transcriptional regulator [Segnochrobactraceae bacterium EtOH-i3]
MFGAGSGGPEGRRGGGRRPEERAERGWPGGRGGGRRMGRLFAHGDLSLVILSLIAEAPSHGYELIKSIAALANGAYSPSPGTIYPALTLLEEQGFIDAEASEGSRKRYGITAAGRDYLAANAAPLAELRQRIAAAGAAPEHAPPAPVIRAMENLKLALLMRLSREPLPDDVIHAIAAAIDRAAGEIERS